MRVRSKHVQIFAGDNKRICPFLSWGEILKKTVFLIFLIGDYMVPAGRVEELDLIVDVEEVVFHGAF